MTNDLLMLHSVREKMKDVHMSTMLDLIQTKCKDYINKTAGTSWMFKKEELDK